MRQYQNRPPVDSSRGSTSDFPFGHGGGSEIRSSMTDLKDFVGQNDTMLDNMDKLSQVLTQLNPQEFESTVGQLKNEGQIDDSMANRMSMAYSSHHASLQNPRIFKEMYSSFGELSPPEILQKRLSNILSEGIEATPQFEMGQGQQNPQAGSLFKLGRAGK